MFEINKFLEKTCIKHTVNLSFFKRRRINTQFLRAIVPLAQKKAFQAPLMTPPRFVPHAVVTAAPLPEGPEDPKIARYGELKDFFTNPKRNFACLFYKQRQENFNIFTQQFLVENENLSPQNCDFKKFVCRLIGIAFLCQCFAKKFKISQFGYALFEYVFCLLFFEIF